MHPRGSFVDSAWGRFLLRRILLDLFYSWTKTWINIKYYTIVFYFELNYVILWPLLQAAPSPYRWSMWHCSREISNRLWCWLCWHFVHLGQKTCHMSLESDLKECIHWTIPCLMQAEKRHKFSDFLVKLNNNPKIYWRWCKYLLLAIRVETI